MAYRKSVGWSMILALSGAAFIARSGISLAQPHQKNVPILRLDYFAGFRGRLANTLDPALAASPAAIATIQMVNAGLVRMLPSGKIAPDLAIWTVSKSHLVYTFAIRGNARFNNGHRVTTADAVYSLQRALTPATASPVALTYLAAIRGATAFAAGKTGSVPGLQIVNRRVLRITVTKPIAYFLAMLAYPTGDILDRSTMQGKTASAGGNYLTATCQGNQGAGPFMFVCFSDQQGRRSFYKPGETPSYTLIPNPHFYHNGPMITVKLPAIETVYAAYEDYLAGRMDASPVTPQETARSRIIIGQEHTYPTSTVSFLTPNVHLPPFADRHCRRAAAYAISREEVSGMGAPDLGRPIYDLMPAGLLSYSVGNKNPHYDLAAAKAEFSQCSNQNTPVALHYVAVSPQIDAAMSAMVGMLRTVGFKAEPNACSVGNYFCTWQDNMDKEQLQLVFNSWPQVIPDPWNYTTQQLRCNAENNIGNWCNPVFDRKVDSADVEWNRTKRARLYTQAQHLALADGGVISLFNVEAHELVKPYVHGLAGTAISPYLQPKNGDWAGVSVGAKHL